MATDGQPRVDGRASCPRARPARRRRIARKTGTVWTRIHGRSTFTPGLHARSIEEHERAAFPGNYVSTTKYEWWNLVPKNLFEQFQRVANFWFLTVSVFQMLPFRLSPTAKYATLFPLCCVLLVTFVKDCFEDYGRRSDDNRVNNRSCSVVHNDEKVSLWSIYWRDLTVGRIVRVTRDEAIPADMVLLSCAGESGVAYVDTAQLDGETTLKPKIALEETMHIQDLKSLGDLEGKVESEHPNALVQSFTGTLYLRGMPRGVPISAKGFLLRGSTLRNTDFIFGLVIFTGFDTKLMRNLKKTPSKRSNVEVMANWLLLIVFALLLTAALGCAAARAVWLCESCRYLDYGLATQIQWVWPGANVTDSPYFAFITFMIGFNNLIPISLYVTLDLVRTFQGFIMERDRQMYHAETESFCRVKTSALMENLGQIQFVLTDKTGTLTENDMRFKACSIAGNVYGCWEDDGPVDEVVSIPPKTVCTPLDTTMWERQWMQHRAKQDGPKQKTMIEEFVPAENEERMRHFFLALATCHTAIVEAAAPSMGRKNSQKYNAGWKDDKISEMAADAERERPPPDVIQDIMRSTFRSPSPDEEALCAAARDFGYFFRWHVASTMCVDISGQENYYMMLVCNEFSSDRKRMSVLVQRKEAKEEWVHTVSGGTSPELVRPVSGANSPELPAPNDREGMTDQPSLQSSNFSGPSLEASVGKNDSLLDGYIGAGPVTLYIKGADNVMLERLREPKSASEAEQVRTALQHMRKFASYGLRTLLVARRELSRVEAALFVRRIEEARSAFMDREQMLEEVANEMERNLELLGVTAIEDRIQDGVPETINMLLTAGVKVWMLTGDNMETAINIGLASRLIDTGMTCFKLDPISDPSLDDPSAMRDVLTRYYHQVSRSMRSEARRGDFKYYLVVHGQLLYQIMDEKLVRLRQLFLALACSSCSLIACRLAPAQKASLVKMIRTNIVGSPLTLAIGDGGNDVSMIQEGHVGVGIMGLEGRQAANAADFSIGQFRFLRQLLFVHGRWNLRRISIVIGYCFYKNFLLVPTMVYYVPFAGFSGTTLYDSYLYASWNVIFTSLPIIAVGVFDYDVGRKMALLVPTLYQLGLKKTYFNWKVLLGWIGRGLFHSVLTFCLMILLFAGGGDVGYPESDYLVMGCWSYGVCVVVANFTLLLNMKAWMDWSVFLVFLSALSFIPMLFVYSIGNGPASMLNPSMAGVAGVLFGQPRLWLGGALVTAACLLTELGHKFATMVFRPDLADMVMEVQAQPGAMSDAGAATVAEAWAEKGERPKTVLEAMLEKLPAAPRKDFEVRPEGNVTLAGFMNPTRSSKTFGAILPINSDGDTLPLPYSPFVNITSSRSTQVMQYFYYMMDSIQRRQWSQIPVEQWWWDTGYDQLQQKQKIHHSVRSVEGTESNASTTTEERFRAIPSAFSSVSSRDDHPPETSVSVTSRHSLRNDIDELKDSSDLATGIEEQKDNVYSLVTLRFMSAQQEGAFMKYFSRQATLLLQRSVYCICAMVLIINVYELIVYGGTIAGGLLCVLTLPCAAVAAGFLREDLFEVFGVGFFILLIALKHSYDFMGQSSGSMVNAFLPVFIIAGERIRFVATSFVLFFHALALVIRYVGLAGFFTLFQGTPLTPQEFAKFWVSLIGITLLSLYYAYQLEKLMRKDFVGLNSIRASRHQMMEILRGIFPEEVITHICTQMHNEIRGLKEVPRDARSTIKEDCGIVSVIFCDICDFDSLVRRLPPTELVQLLDLLWMCFDRVCDKNGVVKIETVGKTYMAAAMVEDPANASESKHKACAEAAVQTGVGMLAQVARRVLGQRTRDITKVAVRVGIHSGIALSGVVGSQKPQFALFGDTVNTASRMQSTGVPNSVHISNTTFEYVKDKFECEPRRTAVKGKGVLDTYLVKRSITASGNYEELFKIAATTPTGVRHTSAKPTFDTEDGSVDENSENSSIIAKQGNLAGLKRSATGNMTKRNSEDNLKNKVMKRMSTKNILEDVKAHTMARRAEQDDSRRQAPGENRARGAAMEIQWVSFLAFLIWYTIYSACHISSCASCYTVKAVIIACVLRATYLVSTVIAGVVTFIKFRRKGSHLESIDTRSFQDVICVSVFMGYIVSTVTNVFFIHETREFWNVFEAFIFAMVLMQICRILLEGCIPAVLCGLIIVSSTTLAGLRGGQELMLECVVSAVILVSTQFMAFIGDPRRSRREHQAICEEHLRVSRLLDSMLPHEVLTEIKLGHLRLAYLYEDVNFLFADIVGFTKYCASHTPEQAVNLVTRLFAEFDDQTAKLGVYKVCTIGDAYVVVNEPRMSQGDKLLDSRAVFTMAKFMLETVVVVRRQINCKELDMRIGLHHGRFVGGVIGTKRLRFDIWGEDVLIANDVESEGKAGMICVSEQAKEVLERATNETLNFDFHTVLKSERSVRTYICSFET